MYKKRINELLSQRFLLSEYRAKEVTNLILSETSKKVVPENRRLLLDSEISDYVHGNFFRCIKPFLSWLKKGETYWLEYKGGKKYEVRSDNALMTTFEMETHQLLTCFVPYNCESNIYTAIEYFHWLGEIGIHHGYIDEILAFYNQE